MPVLSSELPPLTSHSPQLLSQLPLIRCVTSLDTHTLKASSHAQAYTNVAEL